MRFACSMRKLKGGSPGLLMTSLQIRELPEPLHQLLQRRARAHKRSLSQQALFELEQAVGGDAKQRRAAALQRIAAHWQGKLPVVWPESPEALIRADRER